MLAETFQVLAGTRLVDEDGNEVVLELLPPATDEEMARIEAAVPGPLPEEVRQTLTVTTGLANGPLETLSLIDPDGFGMDDVFPYPYSIGHDGFGNFWIVDLLPSHPGWGPIFYACHDPPVIAYQCETVEEFVRDVVAMWQPGPRSPVDVVHEDVTMNIWRTNSGLLDQQAASQSGDTTLSEFAAGFAPEAVFADLRTAKVGDGFSWGRYGPRTEWTRYGAERIWATVPPPRRGLLSRIFGQGRKR